MFATRFSSKLAVMAMMFLASSICSFEVVTAAEAGLGLNDLKAIAKARIQGTLERKAAIIDRLFHRGKATSTMNAATATPTPTTPTGVVVLVVVSFVTRITTFTVANFTAIPQQQYIDAIYQSTPDVAQVLIDSITAGSVIVATSAVLPQTQVSDFSMAANNSFGLPPATFGQPEISPLTVTLAPGNTTLPESTLPAASATPPPLTTLGGQSSGPPPTTAQPQTTAAGGTTPQPQTTIAGGTTPQPQTTIARGTTPQPPQTTAVKPSTKPPATTRTPPSTNPPSTTPASTLDPQCAALTPPTACSNGFCPIPPNSFTYCGCPELYQVNVRDKPSLTDMSYYTCLQRIIGDPIGSSLFLGNLSSLSSFAGLQSLTAVEAGIEIYQMPSLITIDSSSFPALKAVGNPESGGLEIFSNPSLTTISGFEALEYCDELLFFDCSALTSISGFSALTSVSYIEFIYNPLLSSYPTFPALTTAGTIQFFSEDPTQPYELPSIGGFGALQNLTDSFQVGYISSITTINGLNALKSAGSISIYNNNALTAITGFSSLTTITVSAPAISDNTLLTDISGLSALANAYGCTADMSTPVLAVNIQVYPNGPTGGICFLDSYSRVCDYINGGAIAVGC